MAVLLHDAAEFCRQENDKGMQVFLRTWRYTCGLSSIIRSRAYGCERRFTAHRVPAVGIHTAWAPPTLSGYSVVRAAP